VGAKSKVACQLDRIKPEFGRQIVAVNMNVRRLIRLVTIEVEAIRAGSEHRRHPGILAKVAESAAAFSLRASYHHKPNGQIG